MPQNRRISRGRRITPVAELLEHRSLLSGSATGYQEVVIEVPSTYISQQSSQLDVTLVRTKASGLSDAKGSVTVEFSATYEPGVSGSQFAPVDESVTFPAGQSTETVAVPINSGAANPGLVPMQLAVTSSVRQVKGSSLTVDLADSANAIPPLITGVQRVAGGIAITFSKPMDPATVENKHNYVVKFASNNHFNLESVYGVGLTQVLDNATVKIPLRRATYNPATNTVLLVANEQLGSNGSYEISNPASLLAKKSRPSDAHPLTDLEGNELDEGGRSGTFSIRILKGHPYATAAPALAVEN